MNNLTGWSVLFCAGLADGREGEREKSCEAAVVAGAGLAAAAKGKYPHGSLLS